MNDAERIEALQDLFLSGDKVSDGVRNVVSYLLAMPHMPYRRMNICTAFNVCKSTASAWIHDARTAGLIEGNGYKLDVDAVNVERLRELSGRN